VPKWRDIRELKGDEIVRRIGRPTLISGGFPCQDISTAGKRVGIKGKKSGLVFEFLRLLGDIKSNYALFENVQGFRGNGLKEVLGELTKIGYDAEWYSFRASGYGAPHKRYRIFVVAHTNPLKCRENVKTILPGRAIAESWNRNSGIPWREIPGTDRDLYPPEICRKGDGVPARLDRIRCLGNAVVPQQVYPILKAIAEIEKAGEEKERKEDVNQNDT
jgi:DNA (cytosine-5)-methyltransferase 1